MISRRSFIQALACSVAAVLMRPSTATASEGDIPFTADIAQELTERYLGGIFRDGSVVPCEPVSLVNVDGTQRGYIVPIRNNNSYQGYFVLDPSLDDVLLAYSLSPGLSMPFGKDCAQEYDISGSSPVIFISPFEYGYRVGDDVLTNQGRLLPAHSYGVDEQSNKPDSWNQLMIFSSQLQNYKMSGFNSISQFMSYDQSEIMRLTGRYACMVTALSNVSELYGIANIYSDPTQYNLIWNYTDTEVLPSGEQTVPGIVLGGTPVTSCAPGFTNYCASKGSSLMTRTVQSPGFPSFKTEIDSNRPALVHAGLFSGSAHSVTVEAYATLTGKSTGKTQQMLGIADGWNSSLTFFNYNVSDFKWSYGSYFSK